MNYKKLIFILLFLLPIVIIFPYVKIIPIPNYTCKIYYILPTTYNEMPLEVFNDFIEKGIFRRKSICFVDRLQGSGEAFW